MTVSIFNKWNTLRNQILVIFVFVMVIVLCVVGILAFNRVSILLKSNAEEQIQQVAIEVNGRFESVYEQMNMISKQVMTNEDVQQLLLADYDGTPPSFNERQSLLEVTNTIQANATGNYAFEIYTSDYQKVTPMGNELLVSRIGHHFIEEANNNKGKLVWIGQDPKDDNFFLAIRSVSLMNRSFTSGGYLLIRVHKNNFQLSDTNFEGVQNGYTILLDQERTPIISDYNGELREIESNNERNITLNNKEFITVKQTSDITGWTVIILTPVDELTAGISVLRTDIIISGIVGIVIFAICSFFLSTVITHPIVKLTHTMRQASKGLLSFNPKISSTNEINELNNTYNQLATETNHLIEMVYERELTRNRTELKALQAQINPHFLFNTLDALYWSLEDKEEEELAEQVFAMSELFRYTIFKNDQNEWVTIKEEVEHIERYVQIMKMRFGDRLIWEKEIAPELEGIEIPKLLIQPLVENAILHGAANTIQRCNVSLIITQATTEGRLKIRVTDDGPGMDESKVEWLYKSLMDGEVSSLKGNGIAMSNVQKRLRLYYQEEQLEGLLIKSEKNSPILLILKKALTWI